MTSRSELWTFNFTFLKYILKAQLQGQPLRAAAAKLNEKMVISITKHEEHC